MSSASILKESLMTPPPPSFPVKNIQALDAPKDKSLYPYFTVKPSSLMKCSAVSTRKTRGIQNTKERLDAEGCKARRLRRLHSTSKHRLRAEIQQIEQQSRERQVLEFAARQGSHWSAMSPQLALALARAARGALLAEEHTLKLRITEYQYVLETLKDDLDYTHARVHEAKLQVGELMESLFDENIAVDYRPFDIPSIAGPPSTDSTDPNGDVDDVDSYFGSDSGSLGSQELGSDSDM